MIQLCIFDLDGTVLNTAEDLTASVNITMQHFGFPVHTVDEIRGFVGNGTRKLLERSCPQGIPEQILSEALPFYLQTYQSHCEVFTKPYEGIPELLSALKQNGIHVALVSNKDDFLSKKLCGDLLPSLFEVVSGSNSGYPRKPDPGLTLSVMEKLGGTRETTVYIGDSETDVMTARNAGVRGAFGCWGFRSEQQLREAGAERIFHTRTDLLSYLLQN